MNKYLNFLIIFLLSVFVLASATYANEYFPPTASQKHFTHIVKGLPGVVNINWETPVSMWVKVSSKAVGNPPSPKKAASLADILAERGRTALYQPFCVHIYVKNRKEIGMDCVY